MPCCETRERGKGSMDNRLCLQIVLHLSLRHPLSHMICQVHVLLLCHMPHAASLCPPSDIIALLLVKSHV
eukprot:12930714-Prorocentrum_lima.AAC.1